MVAKCDVVVVMGSRSNLKVMTQATNLLKKLGIPCEVRVVSAHRTPRKAHKYIASVEGRGQEFICKTANDRIDLNEQRKRHP